MRRAVWEAWRDDAIGEFVPVGSECSAGQLIQCARLRSVLNEAFRRGVLASYDVSANFDVETVLESVGIR